MKRNSFLRHTGIYLNITFLTSFSEFFISLFNIVKISIFKQEPKLSKLITSLVPEKNYQRKRTFFLCRPQIYPRITFSPVFTILHSLFQLCQNFNFLAKIKTSESHSSMSSEKEILLNGNFFLRHTKMYRNIIFSFKFSEFFIPLFKLVKILIFWQKSKLQSLILKKKTLLKRIFLLRHTKMYRNIIFSFKFSEFFIHLLT